VTKLIQAIKTKKNGVCLSELGKNKSSQEMTQHQLEGRVKGQAFRLQRELGVERFTLRVA